MFNNNDKVFEMFKNKKIKVKIFKSMLLWLFSFSILFFVDFKYAVYLILLLFIRFIKTQRYIFEN